MSTTASIFAASIAVVVFSAPEEIIPVKDGMTWRYNMTEESGAGVRLSDDQAHEAGTFRADVAYRLDGTREVDGRKLLAFEMHREGRLTNTDLLTADEHGLVCWGRIDETGELTKFDSPQPLVGAPLAVGATWEFDNASGGDRVHQHYEVIGQGDITVPAGKYRGFHIRCEQSTPGKMVIDRWFVPGIGIVKDVTETRSDSGELLRRVSLELIEEPKVAPRPEVKLRPGPGKLQVSVGQEAFGENRNTFVTSVPKIYARWQGRSLRTHAKIRVLWIAEEVDGVAPPDFAVDEATTTATAPDARGVLTMARPENGWAPGIYRVEFYVDGALADAVKLKIVKSDAISFESPAP